MPPEAEMAPADFDAWHLPGTVGPPPGSPSSVETTGVPMRILDAGPEWIWLRCKKRWIPGCSQRGGQGYWVGLTRRIRSFQRLGISRHTISRSDR